MSFPISPTNGQLALLNGITYTFNSTDNAWVRVVGALTAVNTIAISGSIASTSTTTGALTVTGGVGIGGAVYISTSSYIAGALIITTATIGNYAAAASGGIGYTGSAGSGGAGAGYTGSTGTQGVIGFTGSASSGGGGGGYTGSAGIGGTGYTGSTGTQGVIGYAGSIGAQGPSGGYTGSAGIQGVQGPSGGYTGSTGTQGISGGFNTIQILNVQTSTSYTLVLGDAGQLVNINNAVGTTLTVPPESVVAFSTGQRIDIGQYGLGYVLITGGSGVVLRTTDFPLLNTQYSIGTLIKIGSNEWTWSGPAITNTGYTGSTGTQGVIGFVGSRGAFDAIGFTGSTGTQGIIGFTGSASTASGYTGSVSTIPGFTGSRGAYDAVGYTGSMGSLPNSSIDVLNDVDTSTTPPTFTGQALVWNTSTSQWKPGTAVGGGGGEFSVFMLAGM